MGGGTDAGRPAEMGGPRFGLGRIVATSGAYGLGVNLRAYVKRHRCGDWGTVGRLAEVDLTVDEDQGGALVTSEDAILNAHAIRHGGRVLSVYETANGRLVIVTDGLGVGGHALPRTETMILLSDEFVGR